MDVCLGDGRVVAVDKVQEDTDLRSYAQEMCTLFEREVSSHVWFLSEAL